MIIMKHRIFGGEDGIIVMFGPKRMNYKKKFEIVTNINRGRISNFIYNMPDQQEEKNTESEVVLLKKL